MKPEANDQVDASRANLTDETTAAASLRALKFRIGEGVRESFGVDPATGTPGTAYGGARA
jgi:hypothetical protein